MKVGDLIEIFQPDQSVTGAAGGAGAGGTQQAGQGGQRNLPTQIGPQPKQAAAAQAPTNTLDPNNALFIKVQSLEPVKGQSVGFEYVNE